MVQQSVSLDKEFFKHLTLSVDYTYYRGVDQLITRNINAPLPGTYNPADPTSGVRPYGTLQNIYEYDSLATTKRNRIFTNFHLRFNPLLLYGYYIFGHSNSNTGGPSSFPLNQYDLHVDYGRATEDIRNRFYLGGLVTLPLKLQLNPFLVTQSNAPFNITIGQDLNGDSQFNDRPAFATDLSRPSVYHTKWGTFDADPLARAEDHPHQLRNGAGSRHAEPGTDTQLSASARHSRNNLPPRRQRLERKLQRRRSPAATR